MSDKRKIAVFHHVKVDGDKHYSKVPKGYGTFHQFGVDCEEFETGVGNYSTAIVEMNDGTMANVPVEMIVFLDRAEVE